MKCIVHAVVRVEFAFFWTVVNKYVLCLVCACEYITITDVGQVIE